jgi:hypothetical protein
VLQGMSSREVFHRQGLRIVPTAAIEADTSIEILLGLAVLASYMSS